ncbi:Low-density lipoprotein receptor-related protein 5 [Holothuria leucospilota]|uniref:Low-density lipoprotein receptor-related protein 5 n=1 Tax=Holothuria leucospilota TaxID=206669 RepID=A0A9Q1CDP4_HOLLE|nr:Low-density lipoprotein receptor-related protein 5 [Holothuria leucospilota]
MNSRNAVFLCLISTLILQAGELVKGQVCAYTLSGQSGTLDYPEGPENYANGITCTWIFTAPAGSVVELTFTNINLEPEIVGICLDQITVYDGLPLSTTLTSPFCGNGPYWPRRPHRFLSTSNKLSITMQTDSSINGTGFVAEYRHVPFRNESIAAINVDSPSIMQFNRFSSYLFERIILSNSTHPSALDFDPITEFFYYTDIDVGFIGRIKYDASLDEMLAEENVQTPLGVAVGYLTGLLYWTDVGRNEVSVSRLDGSFRKSLVFSSTNCNSPRAITLSADQQKVFWTCSRKIMKSNADGSESQNLVEELSDPRTLALDEVEMFLYWVDVDTSSIGRIKTDGTMKTDRFLSAEPFSSVHSFVMDSFTYYLSCPTDKKIIDFDRVNPGLIGGITPETAATMEGLYYYKSDREIEAQHTCATGEAGCQELCFPQGLSFRCVEVTPSVVNCPNEIVMSTSHLYQQVSWEEPSAFSRTSETDRQPLMYDTRTSRPGTRFYQGITTVTYTFKDEFSNTATCSFNVVILPATTTVTVVKGVTTTHPISVSSTNKSPDGLTTEYLVYVMLGIIAVVLCVVLVVVCIVCSFCCTCSIGQNSRRPPVPQPQHNMDFIAYDNNRAAINLIPICSEMRHGYPDRPPPPPPYSKPRDYANVMHSLPR